MNRQSGRVQWLIVDNPLWGKQSIISPDFPSIRIFFQKFPKEILFYKLVYSVISLNLKIYNQRARIYELAKKLSLNYLYFANGSTIHRSDDVGASAFSALLDRECIDTFSQMPFGTHHTNKSILLA